MSRWRDLPPWLREGVVSLLLLLLWVDYLLVATIVAGRALNGAYTDLQQALWLSGFGLLAPLAGWACRVHLERIGAAQPDRWWWGPLTWTQPPPRVPGRVPWWERWHSAALAAGALSLFWMLYAASLLAALVLPVAVWTLVLHRLRSRR